MTDTVGGFELGDPKTIEERVEKANDHWAKVFSERMIEEGRKSMTDAEIRAFVNQIVDEKLSGGNMTEPTYPNNIEQEKISLADRLRNPLFVADNSGLDIQASVYARVEDRGYTKRKDGTDWPEGVFTARQWMKSLDELSEVYDGLFADPGGDRERVMFDLEINSVSSKAHGWFANQDHPYRMMKINDEDAAAIISEMADVVIPLLCAAEKMRQDYGGHLPTLLDEVMRKSAADVARGVSQ